MSDITDSTTESLMHCTLSLTVCKCTPCERASFNSTTDSFSCGRDPYTLACKARPSSDRCWTSLSVSLSLSLSLSDFLAHAFGEFFKKLYDDQIEDKTTRGESDSEVKHNEEAKNMSEIPEFTTAIDQVKRGKCSDSNGIRAEDIQGCDDETKDMIRQIFNKVLKKDDGTKGGVQNVGNHRPICTLHALYNLLSTTVDYLMVYSMLEQRRREWVIPMFISTIDSGRHSTE